MTELDTLLAFKDRLDDQQSVEKVNAAQIHNPTKEVSNALTSFLVSQLEHINADSQFSDLVRMHLRERMGEASIDQLIELLHLTSQDTSQEANNILKMFRNETSGKTVIETLRDNDVSSTAAKLYSEADSKDILQALTYFNQITSKLLPTNTEITTSEVEIVKK